MPSEVTPFERLVRAGNELARSLGGSPGIDPMRGYDLKEWREAVIEARAVAAEAERDALREALEFYADPDTYFAIAIVVADLPSGPFIDDFDDAHDPGYPKPGKRARAALGASVSKEETRDGD